MNYDRRRNLTLISILLVLILLNSCGRFSFEDAIARPISIPSPDVTVTSIKPIRPSPTITVAATSEVINDENTHNLIMTNELQQTGASDFEWLSTPLGDVQGMVFLQSTQISYLLSEPFPEVSQITDDTPSLLTSSALSPQIAWKNAEDTIRVWDVNKQSELISIQLDGSSPTSLALSNYGEILAVATVDKKIIIWDVAEKVLTIEFEQPNWLTQLDFSADNMHLAGVDSENFTIYVFDAKSGENVESFTWTDHASPVLYGAQFSPDWNYLAWVARGSVQIMDTKLNTLGPMLSHEDFVNAIAWSPDGNVLASAAAGTVKGNFSPLVYLWNPRTGELLNTLVLNEPVSSLSFSPDGRELAILKSDGALQVWTVR